MNPLTTQNKSNSPLVKLPLTMQTTSSTSPSSMTPRRSSSCSASACFDRTITLNNKGAKLMDNCDYHGAVKVLERAFFSFKKAYHQHRDSLKSTVRGGSNAAHSTSVDSLFSWKKAKTVSIMEDEENILPTTKLSEDERPSVYSNPIHLPPDFPVTQESCGFLSTSIALNLAMSHHLCGMELFETKKSPLAKRRMQEHFAASGRLYEYTIRLETTRARQYQQQQQEQDSLAVHAAMEEQRLDAASSGPAPVTLASEPVTMNAPAPSAAVPTLFVSPFALMVILNNLGHVNAVLGKKTMSDRFYQRLQSACMYLMARSRTRHFVGTITSADLQIFLHNVSLGLHLIHCHSAAAA